MNNSISLIKENIAKVMIGMDQVTELLLASFLAGGHVLLEDMPGTGKTVLSRALAASVDCRFGRIQFTPDLLPGDVTGISYYNQEKGAFVFREGPVFANILLADEVNRATPRTQSALLECMGEGQVTVDGVTRVLEDPFFVIATENPVETYGCFPLPEAQLDRFLMKLSMGNLTPEQEKQMLQRFITEEPLAGLGAVITREEIKTLRKACRQIFVHEDLMAYMVALVQKTRLAAGESGQREGVSPRGTLALLRASQGYAMVMGRDYVVPEDIKAIAVPVLAHRYICEAEGSRQKEERIRSLVQTVDLPTEDWKKV
ncbi:MAG: AAA family ATPase [Blautia sp.]|nr:AAA family ATPase [Blautia sp.]